MPAEVTSAIVSSSRISCSLATERAWGKARSNPGTSSASGEWKATNSAPAASSAAHWE
jgi:hypothetical protein